ncbi:hypothetical protein CBL_12816 [Carabus blaptoides fortunei]
MLLSLPNIDVSLPYPTPLRRSVLAQQPLTMEGKIDSPAKCELRSVIKFLWSKGTPPIQIHRQLTDVYGGVHQFWTRQERDLGRKYVSGSPKRQNKRKQDELALKQQGALKKFLIASVSDNEDNSKKPENSNDSPNNNDNTHTKLSCKEENISTTLISASTSTNNECEDHSNICEKYPSDIANWPNNISDDVIEHYLIYKPKTLAIYQN